MLWYLYYIYIYVYIYIYIYVYIYICVHKFEIYIYNIHLQDARNMYKNKTKQQYKKTTGNVGPAMWATAMVTYHHWGCLLNQRAR